MVLLLNTPRLILRNFCLPDIPAVHGYASNPEVVQHMNWGPNSESDTQAFIQEAVELSRQSPRLVYHLAVAIRQTGQLIGGGTLKLQGEEPTRGEIGYILHPGAWGQNYGSEVAKALITFGFEDLGLQHIWATCRPQNLGSQRILLKSGLRFQRTIPNERTVRGQWVDTHLYEMTLREWKERSDSLAASVPPAQKQK